MFEIIQELRSSNSALHKKAVLERHKGDPVWLRVLKCTYDPYHNYYIRKIPKASPDGTRCDLSYALDALEREVATRSVTGNDAIRMVAALLGSLEPDDQKVLELIIDRDLDCGIAASTINKVIPRLIPEYPVLLAMPDEPENRARIKFPAYVELKCDGMRVNAHVNKGVVSYLSRKGKPVFANNPELDKWLILLSKEWGYDLVIDGELLATWPDGAPMNRQMGNGICNSAMQGTITDKESQYLTIVCWDLLTSEEFQTSQCLQPYEDRRRKLAEILKDLPIQRKIMQVESKEVNNWEEAQAFYREKIALGHEGLIIKNKDHIWEDKRSKDLVKMKQCISGDFKVVGWLVSLETKYRGMLGSLACVNKDSSIQFNVGSGFTDAQRSELTAENTIGKIVEVEYNAVITKKGSSTKSLYQPVFVRMRPDKDLPD